MSPLAGHTLYDTVDSTLSLLFQQQSKKLRRSFLHGLLCHPLVQGGFICLHPKSRCHDLIIITDQPSFFLVVMNKNERINQSLGVGFEGSSRSSSSSSSSISSSSSPSRSTVAEFRIKSRDSVPAETRDWDPELNPQNRIYLIYWFSNQSKIENRFKSRLPLFFFGEGGCKRGWGGSRTSGT